MYVYVPCRAAECGVCVAPVCVRVSLSEAKESEQRQVNPGDQRGFPAAWLVVGQGRRERKHPRGCLPGPGVVLAAAIGFDGYKT